MYRLYFLPLSIFVLFGVAHSVSASVVINEIAWMGTSTSTNDEWIELKNEHYQKLRNRGLGLGGDFILQSNPKYYNASNGLRTKSNIIFFFPR